MKVDTHSLHFDWDAANSDKNKRKHSVEDWECEDVFFDERKVTLKDKLHSNVEERFIMLGKTRNNRLLYLVFTKRDEKLRIISARDVTKRKEIDLYEKAT